MRATRDHVLVLATRSPVLDPVVVDRHRDFDAAAISRVLRGLETCEATDGDAVLVEEDAPIRVMRLGDLVAWLRDNALEKLAVKIERTHVPPGQVVALVLGDEDARVRVMKVAPPPHPLCAALSTPQPAPRHRSPA